MGGAVIPEASVLVEQHDRVRVLTLSRPGRLNSWGDDLGGQLSTELGKAQDDASVRAVVITGDGDRAFSSGADLGDPNAHRRTVGTALAATHAGQHRVFGSLLEFEKPVVAAVNGYAIGVGCLLTLCCDVIIASPSAVFALPQVSLGILPNYGGILRLAQWVGRGRAMEMALSGRRVGAEEARSIGLVSRIGEDGTYLEVARSVAEQLGSLPPLAVKMAKESVYFGLELNQIRQSASADLYQVFVSGYYRRHSRGARCVGGEATGPVPRRVSVNATSESDAPLAGVTVLDFTRFVTGPYATMLLADTGADVIKVEPLGGEETRRLEPMFETPIGTASAYFCRLNRNKRSLCVDYRSPQGRDLVLELMRAADVVVENFRPGAMDAYGLGYEDARRINPRLVYCSISGFGQTESPHRDDPALAIVAEAAAGVLARTGQPDDPPVRFTIPLGDSYPGSLAVTGICMSLLRRARTGLGGRIDLAMYDALVSLNESSVSMASITGREAPVTTASPSYTAPFGLFETRDGYLCIAVLGEKLWERFCEAIGQPALSKDPRFANGSLRSKAMNGELGQIISTWLAPLTRAEAVGILNRYGIPSSPVTTPNEVIAADQTRARELMWDVDSFTGASVRVVGNPIRMTPSGFTAGSPIPGPGEHTEAVLSTLLGYSQDRVAKLEGDGVAGRWRAPAT